jgi:hypothetical protein
VFRTPRTCLALHRLREAVLVAEAEQLPCVEPPGEIWAAFDAHNCGVELLLRAEQAGLGFALNR